MGGRGQREPGLRRAPIPGCFSVISRQQEAVSKQGVDTWSWSLEKVLPSLRLYLSLQVRGALSILARVTEEPRTHRPWRLWELCSEAGSGVAIRGQERAGYGLRGSLRGVLARPAAGGLGALPGLQSQGSGVERRGGKGEEQG